MGIYKQKIQYASGDSHDVIGAFLRDGAGNAINSTSNALHVDVQNASIAVTATDLDIRDLTHVSDSVKVGDGTDFLAIAADGSIAVTDNGTTLSVDDGAGSLTIDNAELVTLAGAVSGTEMQVDIVASLPAGTNNIGDVDVLTMPGQYVEDAASAGGETGNFMLGIRQDAAGSPVSADGDYHPFVFNNDGELKVAADLTADVADDAADSGNPIKIGGKAYTQASALSAVADADRVNYASDLYRRQYVNDSFNVGWSHATVAISTTAAQLDGSKQAGRKRAMVQNLGDKDIYLGSSAAVTTASGLLLPKDSSVELPWGEALNIYAIGDTGASAEDIRIIQFA